MRWAKDSRILFRAGTQTKSQPGVPNIVAADRDSGHFAVTTVDPKGPKANRSARQCECLLGGVDPWIGSDNKPSILVLLRVVSTSMLDINTAEEGASPAGDHQQNGLGREARVLEKRCGTSKLQACAKLVKTFLPVLARHAAHVINRGCVFRRDGLCVWAGHTEVVGEKSSAQWFIFEQ